MSDDNAGSDPSDDESHTSDNESDTLESDDDFDPPDTFLYMGWGSIPRNARRAEVDRSVEFIPDRLFQHCRQLESVLLSEGLLGIGKWTFDGCSSLRSFQCPSTVTEIGKGSFYRCSNLTAVYLPAGLEEIKYETFFGCTLLEEVQIPASVARIGTGAFFGCTNLASVELREGLRMIGESAFNGCSSLGSLRVPLSVGEIREYAFHGCISLALVRLYENLPEIKSCAFMGCPLESFQFARLSERMNTIRMDNQTTSMFVSRLSEMTRALTGADHNDEDEDDSDEEEDADAIREEGDAEAETVREKCKEYLGRAHEFLTYLELKGASPVLELALWKMKIEGEGEERVQGGLVRDEVRGQDLSEALQARERKRLKVNKDTDGDPQLSRNECRVKCGADIMSSEVLRFFAYRTILPRLDD